MFPVTEFLTSTSDILRIAGSCSYFLPRRHKSLVARAIYDLKFWRRFMTSSPTMSFDFILCRLPVNPHRMASDASTSVGMAGVLRFGKPCRLYPGVEGLFWQLAWDEWKGIPGVGLLHNIDSNINAAEFLASLITCETFAKFCTRSLSTIEVDNSSTKVWLSTSRCTRYPLDRCAQSTHLYMLEQSIKVKAVWIPSEENVIPDLCSRVHFSRRSTGHLIAGARFVKVRPLWTRVFRHLLMQNT